MVISYIGSQSNKVLRDEKIGRKGVPNSVKAHAAHNVIEACSQKPLRLDAKPVLKPLFLSLPLAIFTYKGLGDMYTS